MTGTTSSAEWSSSSECATVTRQIPSSPPKKDSRKTVFFIQAEGLVCNPRLRNVISSPCELYVIKVITLYTFLRPNYIRTPYQIKKKMLPASIRPRITPILVVPRHLPYIIIKQYI